MKGIKNVGKRFLSLALTLAVALTFSAVAPETSYASDTYTPTYTTLKLDDTAVGTLTSTGSYQTEVLDIPTTAGASHTPYEMYNISVSTGASFAVPTTGLKGTFYADENSTGLSATTGLTKATYKVAANETAAEVMADLSKIKYTGVAKVTIVAIAQAPKANDYYYEGRYYRLSTSAVTWGAAMKDTDAEAAKATATYTGYKAHPVTITTKAENDEIEKVFYFKVLAEYAKTSEEAKSNARIWLGAAPASATGYDNLDTPTKPNATCGNATPGVGSSWHWMWNTPEAGNDLPSDGENVPAESRYWWQESQPSGGAMLGTPSSKSEGTYVACMGIAGVSLWDDIGSTYNTTPAYYIVEYSPYANNNWVYSDADNKVIADESNLIARGDFSYMTKSEMTFDSKNVWHPEQDFENNGIKGLKASTEYVLTNTADASETKTLTSDANGKVKLFQTTTDKATTYDLTGKTWKIQIKDATSSVKLTIDARPAASSDDIVKSDVYSADTDKITLIQKEGIEYSINGGVNWTSTTKGGKVAFDRDKNNTTYTVTARKAATSTQYASKESTLNVVTDSSFSAGGAGAAAATESAKSVEDAKITAKTSVEKAATAEKYDKAEAAEVKAISTQAQKDITAAKTTADVEKIQAEAEAKIAAILTSQEKADTAAVKAINSKKLKLTSKLTKKNGKKAVKLTWNAPSSVDLDGYVIYRSVKKSTLGKKVYGTTTKTTYTNAKYLKKGNTYYYKIKGYKTINGEKVYTGWSTRAYRKIR